MYNKFLVYFILLTQFLYPCAVCYGNPEDPMSKGMSMGVLTLVGFIVFVLSIIAYSIISIAMRTKKINNLEG